MPRHKRKIINPPFHERVRMYDYVTHKQAGRNLSTPRATERAALDNAAYGDVSSIEPSKEELIEALVESGKWAYCNSCTKAYPYTAQYFRQRANRRRGLEQLCIECNRDLSRRNMARMRARRLAQKLRK